METICVKVFTSMKEAEAAREMLRQSRIESFLQADPGSGIEPGLHACGARLLVRPECAENARRLLKDPEKISLAA